MAQTMTVSWIVLNSEDGGVLHRLPQSLEVSVTATVGQVLALLPLKQLPAELLRHRQVAIFGQYAVSDTPLSEGDRIEILDVLRFEPNESRLRRAARKNQTLTVGQRAQPRRSKQQTS